MKPLPWNHGMRPLLSDMEVHVNQLVQNNQPSVVRSALAQARASTRYLIRGSRGACIQRRADWLEILAVLECYRHNVRVYVRALKKMGEPTHAQWMAQPDC